MHVAVSLRVRFGGNLFSAGFSPPAVNAEPCAAPALGNLQMGALGRTKTVQMPRSGNSRGAFNREFCLCEREFPFWMSRADVPLDKHHLGKGKGAGEVSGFALLSAQRSHFDHPGKPVSVCSGVRMGLSHGPMVSLPSRMVTGPSGWSFDGEESGWACSWIKVKQEERLTPRSCCSSNVVFPALCKPGLTCRQQKMSNNK